LGGGEEYMTFDKRIVLIVIPDDNLRNELSEALQENGCPFSYEVVSNTNEAQNILSQGIVQAIIMTKSVALLGDDGTNGIITSQLELPPTVTLLQQGDGYPDYLYIPGAFHDWCTIPFDLQELYKRLFGVMKRSNNLH
jgi:DNA-binding response OmpR family regulator